MCQCVEGCGGEVWWRGVMEGCSGEVWWRGVMEGCGEVKRCGGGV